MSRTNSTSFEYLDTAEAVAGFTAEIRDVKDIALDTEGASFHRFVDRIYLLQLSTNERHAIIDPLSTGQLGGLGELVQDPAVQIVFHDADYDLRLLRQDYGWGVTNIFDTRIASQFLGYTSFGLAALLERFFGVKLDKKHQRADWSMRPLTHDMLDYAAQDTRYLLQLRDILAGELAKNGRLAWAQEEFRRLENTEWAAEDPAEAFLRIKGARDLSRRELATLRELAPGAIRSQQRSIGQYSAYSATSNCWTSRGRIRKRAMIWRLSRECRAEFSNRARRKCSTRLRADLHATNATCPNTLAESVGTRIRNSIRE